LNIAMVPQTCGWGCGYVGYKGVEIIDNSDARTSVIDDLNAGMLPSVIVHEMNHNFDLYNSILNYLPDHVHAWTSFMDYYIRVYTRMGNVDQTPEMVQTEALDRFYRPYINDPASTWATCVRETLCES